MKYRLITGNRRVSLGLNQVWIGLLFCGMIGLNGPFSTLYGQSFPWQQRVEYKMKVELDAETHQFQGSQNLTYFNNSPDTLEHVFYHLYFNAFQPGSMMDVRSRTLPDPDYRVGSRIAELKPEEEGYQKVLSLSQNGQNLTYETVGTILEVKLAKPILPGKQAVFEMKFEGQVPVQIRRCGRNNKEGISYSMSQWYPKLCEYDREGWHSDPYVSREFHGVWGDFEVEITLDKQFIVAATGELSSQKMKNNQQTWTYNANNVHDFVWAADPDYIHKTFQVEDGPLLHFYYEDITENESWEKLPAYVARGFQYMNQRFGKYPYPSYAFIQGGDGGMEYPMATLITGHRSLRSLVGVSVHEMIHSWYQMVLATNESLYPWMDEGFTSYASNLTMEFVFGEEPSDNPHEDAYYDYFSLIRNHKEEALSTHADHYNTNDAYGTASYSKGTVFLHQLSYVVGQDMLDKAMIRYFQEWKFRHPTPTDFKRILEKVSGLELDWYFEYFVQTTHTIDYGLKHLISSDNKTYITIERKGKMPMPIEVLVTYKDGRKAQIYIPLQILRGEKVNENLNLARLVAPDWAWTNPTYILLLPESSTLISRIEIDPSGRMADVDRTDNVIQLSALFPSK